MPVWKEEDGKKSDMHTISSLPFTLSFLSSSFFFNYPFSLSFYFLSLSFLCFLITFLLLSFFFCLFSFHSFFVYPFFLSGAHFHSLFSLLCFSLSLHCLLVIALSICFSLLLQFSFPFENEKVHWNLKEIMMPRKDSDSLT